MVIDGTYAFVGGVDICLGRWEYPGYPIIEPSPPNTYFYGKDYLNFHVKALEKVDQWQTDLIDRSIFPRIPWRDVQARLSGPIVNKVQRHFIQYWNFVNQGYAFNNVLLQFSNIFISSPTNESPGSNPEDGSYQVQAVRSANNWSLGLKERDTEKSIYNAYIELIRNAQSFIYIENQYFISEFGDGSIQNSIAQELANKIIKKIQAGERFVLYIVTPLIGDFGGDPGQPKGVNARRGLDLILKTIYKASNSLIKQVMRYDSNWKKYIKIFGLKNHALLSNQPVSEIIYVHSKMMIVDDDQAIIGSANINDRSMLGSRDSEFGVVITEPTKVAGKLNGRIVQKSRGVLDLRMRAWRTIFGLPSSISFEDPLNNNLIQAIEDQAQINEQFYWNIFGDYPSNNILYMRDIAAAKKQPNLAAYLQTRDSVKGFAVPFPYLFLSQEDIDKYDQFAIERLIPLSIFA